MLTVYRSNRAEWLAQVLAEQLRLDPPGPFERVEVIVNTQSTGCWLGEQLAESNGISANFCFPFPGARLRQLARTVLADDDGKQEDPWKASSLAWSVLEVLPELLQHRESETLRGWILAQQCDQGTLNREHWQLARMIADVVDDYALYRSDWLYSWMLAEDCRQPALRSIQGSLPRSLRWQPLLVRMLAQQLTSAPFGLQVREVARQLRNKPIVLARVPRTLRLFGLSSMAPSQVDLLQALSEITNVQIFLLTPCLDLWQRCRSRQERLENYWCKSPLGADWLLEAPRLEALLGRMGAEFQHMLQGSMTSRPDIWRKEDLFASPATIARRQGREPTLLEQLQQQLVIGEDNTPLRRRDCDSSLLFMACPGVLREIQIVRDQILQWLALDHSLEPRDILIMTPQIERFAPFLPSVLNDIDATGVYLPWRLTDCDHQAAPGLCKALLDCLRVAAGRLTATRLELLLTNPALQAGLGLAPEDLPDLNQALSNSGFRWGLDAIERDGHEAHSLLWCLDRWLLGLVLPSEPGLAPGGVAPFSEGLEPDRMVHWWQVLTTLSRLIYQLRSNRSCQEWVSLLRSVIDELSKNGKNWSCEYSSLLSALEAWQERGETCSLNLDATVVVEILTEELSASNKQFDHQSGGLTISALESMRGLPHRVIILMGLDANVFPREDKRPGFHIFDYERRLGDPSPNDRDRYALLEALLSARQHLLITWNSRDEQSGKEQPAAGPVQQWLDWLVAKLEEAALTDSTVSLRRLLAKLSPNSLDLRNFTAKDYRLPRCTDRRQHTALQLVQVDTDRRPEGLAWPLSWPSDDTANEYWINRASSVENISAAKVQSWLMAPQRSWLEHLGIGIEERTNLVEDLEDFELGDWQCQKLVQERLDDWLQDLMHNEGQELRSGVPGNWGQRLAGHGLISSNNVGIKRLEQSWNNLQSCLLSLGPCQMVGGSLRAGNTNVIAIAGPASHREIMQGWTDHLQMCMKGTAFDGTVVIARHKSKSTGNIYTPLYRWIPLKQEQAKAQWQLLKQFAEVGQIYCWPIPPYSGWLMAKEQQNGQPARKIRQAFISAWDGSPWNRGERQKTEMQICFGSECRATDLLDAEIFWTVFDALYTPLSEVIVT